ncbi:hypothetical protein JL722_3206 [Aureococcus anophagefferens]|nr:hypothetical protein JL722_3206 [Aureococcus anophagefferens]
MFCAIARALRSGGGPRAASRRRPSLVARSMADGPAKLVVDPETGEEMSKNALKKLLKKRDIAARKAASAAEKAAAAAARRRRRHGEAAGPPLSAVELDGAPRRRRFDSPADDVWVRARVANVRAKGNSCFLVLRGLDDALETVQCCYFKNADDGPRSKDVLKFLADLTDESVVDARGALVAADVASCSRSNVEIQLKSLFVVTRAPKVLPFLVEDAARSEAVIEASQSTERPFASVGQEARLDYRWLDLRTPAQGSVMRVQAAVCKLFRRTMDDAGFTEIHSPKLVGGESESGAGVFTTEYFGSTACLAHDVESLLSCPGDLGAVFEVGPVFRAENSNTRRHLCEFTGLDFEMPITSHYLEAVRVGHRTFKAIFEGLERDFSKELAAVRDQYPSEPVVVSDEPVVIHFADAIAMLRDSGVDVEDDYGDLSGADELALGALVKEQHGVDFFVVDRYPAAIRPFYTMRDPSDDRLSNSYDFFLRGQEICSGAQRVHDPAMLEAALKAKGIDPGAEDLSPSLKSYMTAFEHGAPPHAGCGFGLERVVFLYLGLDNIRKASLFPRDPKRCAP